MITEVNSAAVRQPESVPQHTEILKHSHHASIKDRLFSGIVLTESVPSTASYKFAVANEIV